MRFIQKTMYVTSITATSEVVPANTCSPATDSWVDVKVKNAPKAKLEITAIDTPAQSEVKALRWFDRTR